MIYILLNSIIISAWCLGFRTVTDKGMLLYWLRKPFENIAEKNKLLGYWLKPFILCVVCFSSVHGTIIYYLLNGWEWIMIISIIISSFINAFVWTLYEKLREIK